MVTSGLFRNRRGVQKRSSWKHSEKIWQGTPGKAHFIEGRLQGPRQRRSCSTNRREFLKIPLVMKDEGDLVTV